LEDDFFIKLMQQEGAKVEFRKPEKRIAGSKRELQVKKPKRPRNEQTAPKPTEDIREEVQ